MLNPGHPEAGKTPFAIDGAIILLVIVTLLQLAAMVGIFVAGSGAALSLLGEGETARNLSTGIGLASALGAAGLTEWLLKRTPLQWLRLSQNPIFTATSGL